jgi:hypothetical protein
LFDNGNCQSPLYSRALEYAVDETAMQATRIWEYRNLPDTYGPFMGNAQRLPGGGTMIGWGGTAADPKLTELRADGSEALEIDFRNRGMFTYRAFRFPWEWTRIVAGSPSVDFGVIAAGDTASASIVLRNVSAQPFTITCMPSNHGWFSAIHPLPIVLAAGESTTVTVRFLPRATGAANGTLYARSASDTDLVAQAVVQLVGHGQGTAATPTGDRGRLEFILHPARPSPFADETAISFDLARPGRVRIDVFDLVGRRVATLADGFHAAGSHQVVWRGKGVLPGAYFCRLECDGQTAIQRFVRLF